MTQRMTNELIEQAARGQVRERRAMDVQPDRGLGLFEASHRRITEAMMKYELVYSTGGHGGPYPNEAKAKAAAERLLKGGKDRWIALINAKDTSNLKKAKPAWILKRGSGWERGSSRLPNIPVSQQESDELAEGVYDRAVTNPAHKPKKLAARLKKELTKGIGKGTKVEIVKAESTMPRGWDYGFYGVLKITLPGGDSLKAAITLHSAKDEASGNAALDAKYGGVVSNPRSRDLDKVLARMISDVSSHLKKKTEGLDEDTKGPAHNFGGKQAPPFTSKDHDGKPGVDPEHKGKKKSKKATEALDDLRDSLAEVVIYGAMGGGTVKTFLLILRANLTQADQREAKAATKRGQSVNIYSLGLGLQAAEKVEKAVKADLASDDIRALDRLKTAISREFNPGGAAGKTLKAIDKFRLNRKPPKYPTASKPRKAAVREETDLTEDLKLGKSDKAVLSAFADKKSAESKKLSTDGTRLDGAWMGGKNLASWKGGKIHLPDTGVRSGDVIKRALKKLVPKNDLAEDTELTEARRAPKTGMGVYRFSVQVSGAAGDPGTDEHLRALLNFVKGKKAPHIHDMKTKTAAKVADVKAVLKVELGEETELAEAVSGFKNGDFWSQEFRGGSLAWFYPQTKLKNGGVKGLLLNRESRKPVNSSITKMDMRLWTSDDPDDEVKAVFEKHPRFEEVERVDPVEALVESVMAERKQTADYGRGASGRASEVDYTKDARGVPAKKYARKQAARGERQSAKKHIAAQMRGESTDLDALRAKLGLGGKVVESTSSPAPAPPKPPAAPPSSTMRRESASFAALQEVG